MSVKEQLIPATNYRYPNVLEMNHQGKRYLIATSGTHAVGIVSDEPVDMMDTHNIGKMLSEILTKFPGTEVIVSLKDLREWVGTEESCRKCKGTGQRECLECDGSGMSTCECPECGDPHDAECPECDENGMSDCSCVSLPDLGKIGNCTFQMKFLRTVLECLPDEEQTKLYLGESGIDGIRIGGDNYFAIVMTYRHSGDNIRKFNVPL